MHVPTCHRGQIISVGIWSPASVLARSTRHNGTFRRWPRHSAYGREPEASHSQGVQVTEEQTYLGEKYWQIQPSHSEVGRYRKDRAAGDAPKVQISSLNHASLEADDVAALAEFYTNVLGFKALDRPNFPFGGAWLQGGNLTLHIIQEDPSVPKHSHCWQNKYQEQPQSWYIRRANHLAFEVDDAIAMEERLQYFGIEYTRVTVPDTEATQLFFYDLYGNGVEVGSSYDEVADMLKKKSSSNGAAVSP